MAERVLVVDDEEDLCRLLQFHLEQAGYQVLLARTAAEALLTAGTKRPQAVVLDVMLPDLSGVEVCKRLRSDKTLSDIGILMLTALGDDDDRVGGLLAGADDYVVKPFNVKEVVLRIGALCRRIGESQAAQSAQPSDAVLTWRDLKVDPRTHDTFVGDTRLSLRPLEFKLLVTLLSEPGRVFSRSELLQSVWDIGDGGNPRTVDVHVRRLRQNLGSAADVVETVPGFGYRASRQ
jgi:DNA-binding response OmpR family regulator